MKLIDTKIFTGIKNEIEAYDDSREKIIILSRDVLKNSKLVIYSLQRDDLTGAKKDLDTLENSVKKIRETASKNTNLKKEGSFRIAMQEYCEAITFYYYSTGKKLPSHNTLKISGEDYLLGLCDLTGELGRKAVLFATDRKMEKVKEIRDLVTDIHGQMLKLNLRNGELRKKSDSIKWNLKKIEEVMFDISKR